ncbi:MAG: (Fe-S)-binding protein [Bacteroidia bacterium]|nr:(Fe-S)-binding protein [Bacteroidia bacterium]MCZ2276729.1 (Fe-S)-binding protein [Bacteroidia bacterium]
MKVKTYPDFIAEGSNPDILFWVGCASSFDERAQKVTRAVAFLLEKAGVTFAVLGTEESCNGDPAKRAGNEFLYQLQAMSNIQVMNGYGVKKIVTACPHCFNTLKNEYPDMGGKYEVLHHSMLIQQLLNEGKLKVEGGKFLGKKIVYHDPCYLGRGNNVYEAPRDIIKALDANLSEMQRNRENGFCCGAGGAQIFKESEKGDKEINIERTEEALGAKPDYIAVSCPFCILMLTDGVKHFSKEKEVKVVDVAELLAASLKQ